jgi:hypothetical protein
VTAVTFTDANPTVFWQMIFKAASKLCHWQGTGERGLASVPGCS